MTSRDHVFTQYVRSLDPRGGATDPEHFAKAWRALARVLRREIQRRGLWESPPSYLGVFGWERFGIGEARTVGGGALEELLTPCYLYVFVERLGSLRSQLQVKSNIEGLITLSVRHFLHDIQRQHDPLGFRIFAMLRAAVRGALEGEHLFVLGGDPQLRNNTLLGIDLQVDPADANDGALVPVVASWNDVLLPELVTARGPAHKRMVTTLESLVIGLPAVGIEVFRFGPLVDEMKRDVRSRWGALFETTDGEAVRHEGGELVSLVRHMRPDLDLEARDRFHKLASCLAESVEREEASERIRSYLRTLWEFVRAWAAEQEPVDTEGKEMGNAFPSVRRLAKMLRIPRGRLPELFDTLQRMARHCSAAISSNPAVSTSRPGETTSRAELESPMSKMPKNWQALLEQTDLARQRQNRLEAELEVAKPPQAGDLFVAEASAEQPVEWAVLAVEGSARLQVVAVDSSPLLGSADLAAQVEQRGSVSVRCAYTAWVAPAMFQGSRATGRLTEEALDQVRQKVRRLAAGEAVGNAWERDIDTDPEYHLWQEEVLEPARNSLPALGPKALSAPPAVRRSTAAPGRWRRWRQPLALAASVLMVLSLGLGREVLRMRQEVEHQASTHRQQLEEMIEAHDTRAEALRRAMEEYRREHEQAQAELEEKLAAKEPPPPMTSPPPMASPPPAPLVNLPFVVLESTRSRGDDREISLTPEADYLLVLLQVETPQPGARYRLQLVPSAGGGVLWSHRGLVLTGGSELSVALPRKLLEPGAYQFLLSVQEGEGWRQLHEYGLRVGSAEGGTP